MRRPSLPGIALGSASIAAAVTVLVLLVTREPDRGLPAPQANLMSTVFTPPPCVRIVLALGLEPDAEATLLAQCTAQR